MNYEAVIGLEVHAELLTRSKMFCGCAVVDSTQAAPNTVVCPGCAGLPGSLPAERLKANFNTAAQYHMYCALAILAVGLLAATGRGGAALEFAGWSFLLGSIVFSGSLYVLAATGIKSLGMITPVGGLIMIAAWVALAMAAGTKSSQ